MMKVSPKPPQQPSPKTSATTNITGLQKKWNKSHLCKAAMAGQSLKQALQSLRLTPPHLQPAQKTKASIEKKFRAMVRNLSPIYHENGHQPLGFSDEELRAKNVALRFTETYIWQQFFNNQAGAFKANFAYLKDDPSAIEDNNKIYQRFQTCEKWLRAYPEILDRLITKLPD